MPCLEDCAEFMVLFLFGVAPIGALAALFFGGLFASAVCGVVGCPGVSP